MCGRFGFIPKDDFYKRFSIINTFEHLEPHYNIVPSMMVPVITKNSPKKITLMRWGFIPQWTKDLSQIKPQINARAEGIETKPFFRQSFKKFRCLIPGSHFFEWKAHDTGKIPYCIKLKNTDMFAFAGIYSEINDAEGRPLRTFAIITTVPNETMRPIHNRMPVILKESFEDAWLDETSEIADLIKLLKPFADTEIESFSVSKLVNNTSVDTIDIIKPFSYPAQSAKQTSFL
jgi:putative SOS response-associated peptidase YedK